MKKERQAAVLKVISEIDVETQNQLIEELTKLGIESTQATVSRDIKELHLIKEMTPQGMYRYTASGRAETQNQRQRLTGIFKECIVSYSTAQNIVVVKTLPGLAPAACGTLDAMSIADLIGTIAGDDTAFLAMKDIQSANKFCLEIEDMLL